MPLKPTSEIALDALGMSGAPTPDQERNVIVCRLAGALVGVTIYTIVFALVGLLFPTTAFLLWCLWTVFAAVGVTRLLFKFIDTL